MGWETREQVPLVVLGDKKGHVKKVGGLLKDIIPDPNPKYQNKYRLVLITPNGKVVQIAGNAAIMSRVSPADIGLPIKMEFQGRENSANGEYKVIQVDVWRGELTPQMKQCWPNQALVRGQVTQPGKAAAAAPPKPEPKDDFGDFPEDFPPPDETQKPDDDEDDLPF